MFSRSFPLRFPFVFRVVFNLFFLLSPAAPPNSWQGSAEGSAVGDRVVFLCLREGDQPDLRTGPGLCGKFLCVRRRWPVRQHLYTVHPVTIFLAQLLNIVTLGSHQCSHDTDATCRERGRGLYRVRVIAASFRNLIVRYLRKKKKEFRSVDFLSRKVC